MGVESGQSGSGSGFGPGTPLVAECPKVSNRVSHPVGSCCLSDLTVSTDSSSVVRMPPAAEAALGAKMSSMESRMSGLEARVIGVETILQRIADIVVGPT